MIWSLFSLRSSFTLLSIVSVLPTFPEIGNCIGQGPCDSLMQQLVESMIGYLSNRMVFEGRRQYVDRADKTIISQVSMNDAQTGKK